MPGWDGDEMATIARARTRQRELDRAAAASGRALGAASMDAPRFFRVAVVGDAETGKSCLCDRWAGKPFAEDYEPTADAEGPRSVMVTAHCAGSGPLLIELIDWAWDQVYQLHGVDVGPKLAEGKDACVAVFSYAVPDSFKHLPIKFVEYDRAAGGKPPVLFVGAHGDAPKRRVKDPEVWDAVRKRGRADFASVSSLTGEGAEDAARALCRLLVDDEALVLTDEGIARGGAGPALPFETIFFSRASAERANINSSPDSTRGGVGDPHRWAARATRGFCRKAATRPSRSSGRTETRRRARRSARTWATTRRCNRRRARPR